MSVNKTFILGNVGRDPEVREVGGAKVATFTVATTEKYKDSKSGEWKENTEWHSIVAWRNTAELAEKYIKKGTQLFIEGKLRTRSYDDNSGNKRYVTEIVAESIQLLGKKEGGNSPAPAAKPGIQYKTRPIEAGDADDADLPF